MKKILVPTDFSKNAFNALKYAVQLFQEKKCIFYLLNTYTPVLYNSEYLVNTVLSMDEIYKHNSVKGLLKVAKRIKKEFSNDKHIFKTISSFNTLNEEIKDQVKARGIDLVVMGTQGVTGAEQVLMGTNTVHAIKKASCPLLAIPSNFKFRKPKNILYATDYENQEIDSFLRPVTELAKDLGSTINVLHIISEKQLTPEQLSTKKLLLEYLKDIPHHFYTIEQETIPKGIIQFQKENSMDMLVMITQKHSFFESLFFRPVVNTIGLQLTMPFMVIPIKNH